MTNRILYLSTLALSLVLVGALVTGCELEDLCGNGTVDSGEECDEGDANGTVGSQCTTECKSGTVGEGEGEAKARARARARVKRVRGKRARVKRARVKAIRTTSSAGSASAPST